MTKLQAATDTLRELALVYAVLVFAAALLFMRIEAQSFADSLYWAGATATSTGYGDITPRTGAGRALAFVLMHLSIFGVAPLIVVRLVDRLSQDRDAFTHEEQMEMAARLDRIEAMLLTLHENAPRVESRCRPAAGPVTPGGRE